MPMRIRYHLDENVPTAIANGLRLRGIDVSTTKDAGLLEAADEEHIEWAKKEMRVIFSCDDDFLRLASRHIEHAGIVYCHQRHRSVGDIVCGLVNLWRAKTAEEMSNQIHFL